MDTDIFFATDRQAQKTRRFSVYLTLCAGLYGDAGYVYCSFCAIINFLF
jgi:hypothetical protein